MNLEEYLSNLEVNLERQLVDRLYENNRYQVRSKDLLATLSPDQVASVRYDYRPDRLARQSLFAFEGASRLLLAGRNIDKFTEQLRFAAEAFEHLTNLGEGPRPHTAALLSAGLYQLAGYQANSACLARALELPQISETAGPGDAVMALQRWVTLALHRQFVRILREASISRRPSPDQQAALLNAVNQGEIHPDALVAGPQLTLLESMFASFSRFALLGVEQQFADAKVRLADLQESFARTGQANESLLLRVFESCMYTLRESSTWRLLHAQIEKDPLWHRYAMLLARGRHANQLEARGVVELWRSQRVALERGLLAGANKGLVIRMPTGAGKTRIAELAIMQSLGGLGETRKVVYVAPFRSLSDEVEANFSGLFSDLGFSVSSVLGSFELDEFQDYLLRETDLLITTPEKLNLLSRARPEFFESVRLLILDEGHVIDDTERGARYELLLSRLKRRMPVDAQVLFISAVMPDENAAEFAEWLCDSRDALVNTDWRPARQLVGLFTWRGRAGQIQYPLEAAAGANAPFVPRAIRINDYVDFTPKLRREKLVSFPTPNKSETAAELAIRFAEFGPVLIFAPRPDWAESCARAVQRGLTLRRQTDVGLVPRVFVAAALNVEETASLEAARKWIGGDALVTSLLREGVGVHHRGLPEPVRRAMEDDFRVGRFPVLVATNTLGQGVNLPIKTVIVHSVARYNAGDGDEGGRMEYVNQRDFWNIAGRAGRAGAETEGQIVFVALNEDDVAVFRVYARREYEPIRGRLFAVLRELTEQRLSQEDFAKQLDSELLTILLEESVGTTVEERIESVLGTSLVSIQAAKHSFAMGPLLSASKRVAVDLEARIQDPDRRRVYAVTGLRISSCEFLAEGLEARADEVRRILTSTEVALEDVVRLVFESVQTLPQMEPQYAIEADYLTLLMQWMSQMSVSDIVAGYANSEVEAQRLTRFLEDYFGFRLPWGMSGFLQIAKQVLGMDELPPMQRFLPSMVKYGVNHPLATWPMSLGCPSRTLAASIATEFNVEHSEGATLAAFMGWFSALSEEDFVLRFGATSHEARVLTSRARAVVPDRSEFIESVRSRPASLSARVVGTRYEGRETHALSLEPASHIDLRRDYGNPYDRNAIVVLFKGNQIGFVERHVARLIAPEIDCGLDYTAKISDLQFHPFLRLTMEVSRSTDQI